MTDPLPRSRGTVFVQVLIAALFLAVIGGSVGFALGLRDRDRADDRSLGDRGSSATGTGTSQTGDGATPRGDSPSQQGDENASSTPCPEDVERRAGRYDLAQALYVQTGSSEVWICRDDEGGLYYLGHRFKPDAHLFLTDVERNGDEYVAQNSGTVYRVSRQRLVIEDSGREPEEQPVINSNG